MFQDRSTANTQLQGEIWRLFLFFMLGLVLVEGILILPARPPERQPA
jgi:hypothetical protein